MDLDEDEEEKEKAKGPKFPLCMYITEGVKYLKLRLFDKAIDCFETALEREPTNEKSLLGRAKCFMNKAMYTEAKDDAEAALRKNPKSPQAQMLKADAEYFLGDFERSFLTCSRGYDARPNYGEFKLGFQSCRRSIDNALRPDEQIYFDEEDIEGIERLLSGKYLEEKDGKKFDGSNQLVSYEDDIQFLKNLLSDEIMEQVHPECEYLVEFLEGRQHFWKYQNPKTSKDLKNPDNL
ncbi:Tetratricopeptide repeat protein 25 like protein [Argiope bruennichi]|uniref:Outer dynein arm-docking complex subunit 4 n=1 Tax=Argiope bruennichi TaxID=94029 RepID=A0A8T0DYD0_ARGBR|nr:Tetratricopeptide repeat protein 25 like protein [Argiope bruennichi]